jgi:thiamine kinase-like enzyme
LAKAQMVALIRALPFWSGPVVVEPLAGGMTNLNYRVRDGRESFVARLGQDLPLHGVSRSSELSVARAAHAAGISPEVVFAGQGVMVSRFVEGRTLDASDLRDPQDLGKVVELIRRCHHGMPRLLPPGAPSFRVFEVIRSYAAVLRAIPAHLLAHQLDGLLALGAKLEDAVGALGPGDVVFGHNDLLAGNFIDDGVRLWLIDWEYAGFNSPLFDLANLSTNNAFTLDQSNHLLRAYFGVAPDAAQRRALEAMQAASMLREVLWGAVSHHRPQVAFDYASYMLTWLQRLRQHPTPAI